MKRLLFFVPVAGFVVLAIFLFASLFKKPDELPSVLIGRPAPAFPLAALDARTAGFGPKDLRGRVTLVNVWASWCAPCREEAPMLHKLGATHQIALIGFVWKDTPQKARSFLNEVGNPFEKVGIDRDGRIAMEWGVYGVPETYVIDRNGIVRERFTGALTPEREADIWTAIHRAQSF